MGGEYWDTSAFDAAAAARKAAGDPDFGYSNRMRNLPRDQRTAAPELDVFGATRRESRDSDEHPASTPIVVLFDVTGSMGMVPVTVQKRLADLLGLLTRGGYTTDPQIMIGAIGDDQFDDVPLQIGQFESDNRIDEQLRNIYLEGGGGGDKREGYALAAYFLNTRAQTDAWDRRGRKGYVFFIGDEMNKPAVYARSVRRVLGDELTEDLAVEQVYEQLARRWHTFYVLPDLTSYYNDPEIENHWRPLVGERFLKLDDPAGVADLIALTIGMTEDAIDLKQGLADLKDAGSTAGRAVGKALIPFADRPVPAGGGRLPEDL
ncbi:hypothetical protein GII33_15985 [Gordonia pseudamarae]|uniref:hypothetical protein n=1 Tax=Gordonia pseudamarae TaxID=2831662 RepID=UPI001AF3FAAD|nr:hypothetical protein [Gordonia pseudamarae]QHN27227.1 hypothetical protein GII33_15985 [Gordonia pseudamarae]